jgi:type I restriction enzyme S subunit
MTEWKTYKLGDLGTLARGKSKHRPRDASFLYGGKYPFIQTGDIKAANHKISTHTQTLSDEGLKQSKLWDKGTICITIAANIADTAILAYPACFPDSVIGFVPNKEVCDVDFMEYQLQFAKRNLQSHSIGSVQDNINLGTFLNFTVDIPDLPTQTQIAQILTSLDDKIELNLQMNQTLEAMAQALFKEWFVNFNFPNFDGELQNDLPKGWRMGSLSEIISFVVDNRGKTPNTLIEKENNYPLIEVNSLINSRVVTQQHLAKKYVDDETYNNWFRKGHPQKGDVLFSTVGSIGEISLVFDEKFCIAQNIIALRSIFNGSFLFFTLKNLKQSLLSLDISSVQPSIKVPHLLKSEILIPNEGTIKAYEESIFPIIEKVNENSIQIQTLTQTRDTLLPKLMSGKLELV